MDEGIEKLDLDDNATKWPDRSKRILDPHDCLGLVAVLWFLAVLGLDTTINHWGLADEHLTDEEMMLMANVPWISKFSHPPVGLVGVFDLKGGEGDSLFIFAHLDGHPLREGDNLGVLI